jgi:hypothetical protein
MPDHHLQGNLIYLALITNRVPIIGAFTPSHVNGHGHAPHIPFGDVFDVPRLRKHLNKPVLEWREVKDYSHSSEVEEIGCWSTWEAVQERETFPRGSSIPIELNLGPLPSSLPPTAADLNH